jgi:type II secretory pathway pseudopilin PulG
MRPRRGATLIEVLVSCFVFGLLMSAIGNIFVMAWHAQTITTSKMQIYRSACLAADEVQRQSQCMVQLLSPAVPVGTTVAVTPTMRLSFLYNSNNNYRTVTYWFDPADGNFLRSGAPGDPPGGRLLASGLAGVNVTPYHDPVVGDSLKLELDVPMNGAQTYSLLRQIKVIAL